MSESKVQAKILKYLQEAGYYTIKTIITNKNGTPDIVGCDRAGRFFALEVKSKGKKATTLQQYKLNFIKDLGGISAVVYSVEDVKSVFRTAYIKSP